MGLRERARADAKRREQERTERQKKRGAARRKRLNEVRRETSESISELLDVDLSPGALGPPDDKGGSGVTEVEWTFELDGFRLRARWKDGGHYLFLVIPDEEGDEARAKPIRRPADLLEEA